MGARSASSSWPPVACCSPRWCRTLGGLVMASPRRSILVTANSAYASSDQGSLLPAETIQLNLRIEQAQVINHQARFLCLVAHRRLGKTVASLARAVVKSRQVPYPAPKVHYFAPTRKQAKRVAWDYVHEICEPLGNVGFSETELVASLPWGAKLFVEGCDDPDAGRGGYSDFAVLDEPAQMSPRFWSEVLRPALSDRRGGALFIGTPKGRHGLLYDAWCQGSAGNDPEWGALMFKASQTGIIAASELASARRTMSKAEYEQEYECSFDAAVQGAYWAEAMQRLEAAAAISDGVLHRPVDPVHIVMDLGINDATACWFVQLEGDLVRVIDYAEYTNRGLPDIMADWRLRPYTYGKVVSPHDTNNRSLSTGESRATLMRRLGADLIVCDRLPVNDGIEAVRMLLPRCQFNATRCKDGIEALRQYRSDWEEQKGVLSLRPVHDWTSHAADAFRYLAVTGTARLAGGWGGALDYSRMDATRCA